MYLPFSRAIALAAMTVIVFSLASIGKVNGEETVSAEKWIELTIDEQHWETCNFGGDGELDFQKDQVVVDMGDPMTGIRPEETIPQRRIRSRIRSQSLGRVRFFCGFHFSCRRISLQPNPRRLGRNSCWSVEH